eukprot:NODE_524_length_6494_cov_0.362783.p1 type:complete len:140 gc:universal NODE_524_length_6494_cov_0.362783:1459-1040(-)
MQQFAYKSGISVESALFTLQRHISQLNSKGKQSKVSLLLLDLKQAFDKVSRRFFLEELITDVKCKSLTSSLYDLLNVHFKLRIDSILSNSYSKEVMIIQGSSLSPILFTYVMGRCFEYHKYLQLLTQVGHFKLKVKNEK